MSGILYILKSAELLIEVYIRTYIFHLVLFAEKQVSGGNRKWLMYDTFPLILGSKCLYGKYGSFLPEMNNKTT